jgi:hypothetical protein
MFQSALIRQHHGSGLKLVDAGTIAETLLFYGKVNIVANKALLLEVMRATGPQRLAWLIDNGFISIIYTQYMDGVFSNTVNYVSDYGFSSFKISKTADGKTIRVRDEIKDVVHSVTGRYDRTSRKLVERFIETFAVRGPSVPTTDDALLKAHQELDDPKYLKPAIATLISYLAPSYNMPTFWTLEPLYSGDKVFLRSDLNFADINQAFLADNPGDDRVLELSYFLSMLLEARIDSDLSATYMSELVTRSYNSDLIRLKYNNILSRRDSSTASIEMFQEVNLKNSRAVSAAINSGERTFDDFIPVLENSLKFKKWVSDQNPDANLLCEYINSITSDSWVSSLPAKTVRYVISSTVGFLNIPAGLAVAAGDEFIVDRIFRGWKPNQFVNGPLKRFVSPA